MAEIVTMPKLGFDMAEGTLVRWVIAEGDAVSKNAVLAEIETDKATVEVESAYEGVVLHQLVKEGTVVPVNMPIAVIGRQGEIVDLAALGLAAGEKTPVPAPQAAAVEAVSVPLPTPALVEEAVVEDTQLPGGVKASPLARRIALERSIDLRKVKGTGPGGRIVRVDVETYQPAAPQIEVPIPSISPVPVITAEIQPETTVPLNRLRSLIGRRMTEVKQQVPHFYVSHEYDVAALLDLRKQLNALLPEEEKISVNDFIVKATALTLRAYPNLNASIDLQKNAVIRHSHINIGVAVGVENGLLTVVCRDADLKSVHQIAVELRVLVGRARDGKVRPEDIEGSTFSTSNLGMYNVENFIAIINPPEAAILAIGSAREVPVVENGEVKAGQRMKATVSIDHRVSDGVEGARFLQELSRYLEEPLRLMI